MSNDGVVFENMVKDGKQHPNNKLKQPPLPDSPACFSMAPCHFPLKFSWTSV